MRTAKTAKDPRCLHADSEDSDQTGRTVTLLVLLCRGSNNPAHINFGMLFSDGLNSM